MSNTKGKIKAGKKIGSGRSLWRHALSLTSLILALSMLALTSGACEKKDGQAGSTTKAASVSRTATAAVTTVKATAAAATSAASAAKTSAAAAVTEAPAQTAEAAAKSEEKGVIDEYVKESDKFTDVEVTLDQGFVAGDIDFGGRTIMYGTWAPAYLPSNAEDAVAMYALLYLRLQEAQKKYNFKIDYRIITNSTLYLNTFVSETLAGIPFADVFRSSCNYLVGHVKQKLVLPLDDYIDYSLPIIKANAYNTNGSYWMGNHYGITEEWENATPRVIYNRSIIEREGQPDILDLVEKEQWNWDTFLTMAINCTRDLNGDGITDQWGLTSYKGFAYCLPYNMLLSNDVTCVDFDAAEKPVYTLTQPRARRALQFALDLVTIHKVHMESTTGGIASPTLYMQGNAAIYLATSTYNKVALQQGMNSIIAPLPKGPDTDIYTNISAIIFGCIPVTCKNPRDVARMWMEMCIQWDENGNWSDEYRELVEKKVPYGFDWNPANPNRTYSTEREQKLSREALFPNKRGDFSPGFPTTFQNLINNNVFVPVVNGSASINQVVTQIEYEAQSIINDTAY